MDKYLSGRMPIFIFRDTVVPKVTPRKTLVKKDISDHSAINV